MKYIPHVGWEWIAWRASKALTGQLTFYWIWAQHDPSSTPMTCPTLTKGCLNFVIFSVAQSSFSVSCSPLIPIRFCSISLDSVLAFPFSFWFRILWPFVEFDGDYPIQFSLLPNGFSCFSNFSPLTDGNRNGEKNKLSNLRESRDRTQFDNSGRRFNLSFFWSGFV